MASEAAQTTLSDAHHVHIVGIGGSGMSAIAWVLLGYGYAVSGSDLQENALTAELATAGATIFQGHDAEQVAGADLVVVSSAVRQTNPEVAAARAAGLPVLKRADFLGQLMAGRLGIAIAGTHGKTTTTGMIAQILLAAGRDPSIILGGVLPALGRNGRAGRGDTFVIEADEYDNMFLGLRPTIAVVNNVEHDHPDIFPTEAAYHAAFRRFVALLPAGGLLVLGQDDPGARRLAQQRPAGVRLHTYSLDEWAGRRGKVHFQAMLQGANESGGSDFMAYRNDVPLGQVRLRIPGEHNVRNALAAITVATYLGVDFPAIQETLAAFGGVERRFQIVGEAGGVLLVDDYAHHPTEIRVTLAAARQQFPGRRLWAVWQPHTYSRTRLLLDEFAASFAQADHVIGLDIYRSRERDSFGMDTAAVLARMDHPEAHYAGRLEDAAAYILDRVRPGDVLITLGAGDGNLVGQWVLDGLRQRIALEE